MDTTRDDLATALGTDPNDPLQQHAIRLVAADNDLLAKLVAARRQTSLTVEQVAERMGIPPYRVRALEAADADPRLSTLRRYALAIGAEIEHAVDAPISPVGADTEFKETARNLNPDAEIQGNAHVPALNVDCTADEAACVHGQTADLTGLAAREDTR